MVFNNVPTLHRSILPAPGKHHSCLRRNSSQYIVFVIIWNAPKENKNEKKTQTLFPLLYKILKYSFQQYFTILYLS